MTWTSTQRMIWIAAAILVLDQLTKLAVVHLLPYSDERVIINGFFKFVHWGNTGAAWSMFHENNLILAGVSAVALVALYKWRDHFEAKTVMGQVALGLIMGGIAGNLWDRICREHVIDFLRFYLYRRGSGEEIGFPAFNLADSAICVGVGLLILISWIRENNETARP